MNRLLVEIALGALAALSIVLLFHRVEAESKRADAAENALEVEKRNVKIVERVVEVEKEIIRREPVIGAALQRLCEQAHGPRTGAPDEAAGTETGDVQAGGIRSLGPEVAACLSESEAFYGLQEAVVNAGCGPNQ